MKRTIIELTDSEDEGPAAAPVPITPLAELAPGPPTCRSYQHPSNTNHHRTGWLELGCWQDVRVEGESSSGATMSVGSGSLGLAVGVPSEAVVIDDSAEAGGPIIATASSASSSS